ncbi:MAG: hypothetical protein OEW89_08525 [Gammaproteobacteria bacterium]|nr:hypothetical protein [Gammaproteobacteria bacterium]MDH5593509.1 hypothetical protein [Gammaproteobacteria bacterium]
MTNIIKINSAHEARKNALAKITIPRKEKWLLRERLFAKLDEARKSRVIWVSSPGGSGKTVLLTSYIKRNKLPCIWYTVDEGDGDIASFFYYMGMAGKNAAPRRRKDLPLLTPEYMAGLPVFARNFFRELFDQIKAPGVLVLDNYQDLPVESQLHDLLPFVLQECPQDISVIVVSRKEPPPQLARLRVHGEIALLGWEYMRLTREETDEIAKLQGRKDLGVSVLDTLHEKTEGWIAALVLMLNQANVEQQVFKLKQTGQYPEMFDYFASEVLGQMTHEEQHFLLKTTLLPRMTVSMATSLTNYLDTAQLLKRLVHEHFFTYAHRSAEIHYEYHSLFKEFLLSRGKEVYDEEEWRKLHHQAANLLVADGSIEEAGKLLMASGNQEQLAGLILGNAQKLIKDGRYLTLNKLLKGFSDNQINQQPWLLFWRGNAKLPVEPLSARQDFTRAYEFFLTSKDVAGLYLSWCGIIESCLFYMDDFNSLIEWLKKFDALHERYPAYPDPMIEARVVYSVLAVKGVYTGSSYEEDASWIERAEQLVLVSPDPDYTAMLGGHLCMSYVIRGSLPKYTALIDTLLRLAESTTLQPLSRLFIYQSHAQYLWITGDQDQALEIVDEGLGFAQQSGVPLLDGYLYFVGLIASLLKCDSQKADALLAQFEQKILCQQRRIDRGYYNFYSAWLAAQRGNIQLAHEFFQQNQQQAEQVFAGGSAEVNRNALAQIMADLGQYSGAKKQVNKALNYFRIYKSDYFEFSSLITAAWIACLEGDEKECAELLRQALKIGREKGYVNYHFWRREVITKLCVKALEQNIEVEYVQSMIQRHNLMPDVVPVYLDNWPWKIKIYTLNRFGIIKDGEPLRVSDKVQKFLKALIAFGGRNVNEETISSALWPDAEGDAAHQAFATTLHRVRKLIGNDLIQLRQNQVSLDSHYCWTDFWALQRSMSQIDDIIDCDERLIDLAERIIHQYQGPFLGHDESEYWMISTREQLSNKILRTLNKLGEKLCRIKDYKHAIYCYQKGIEVDELSENAYRGLMHCHLYLGNQAEGLAAYHQCRERLSSVLNVSPSKETENLRQSLENGS